ncbi:TPA: hypothetical protein ACN976_000406 [Vibrio campbellii]
MYNVKQINLSPLCSIGGDFRYVDSVTLEFSNNAFIESLFKSNIIELLNMNDYVSNEGIAQLTFAARLMINQALVKDNNGKITPSFAAIDMYSIQRQRMLISENTELANRPNGFKLQECGFFDENTKLAKCSIEFKGMALGKLSADNFCYHYRGNSPTMSQNSIRFSITTAIAMGLYNSRAYQLLLSRLVALKQVKNTAFSTGVSYLLEALTSKDYIDHFDPDSFDLMIKRAQCDAEVDNYLLPLNLEMYMAFSHTNILKSSPFYHAYIIIKESELFARDELIKFLSLLTTHRGGFGSEIYTLIDSDGEITSQFRDQIFEKCCIKYCGSFSLENE